MSYKNATHSRNISFDLSEERVSYEIFYFVNEKLLVRMCRLLVQVLYIWCILIQNLDFSSFTKLFLSSLNKLVATCKSFRIDEDKRVNSVHIGHDCDEPWGSNVKLNLSNCGWVVQLVLIDNWLQLATSVQWKQLFLRDGDYC